MGEKEFPPPDLELITGPNEAMFVPSGWFHTVINLDDIVISVNQNWGNSHNLLELARLLAEGKKEVEEAIEHLKDDMEEGEFEQTVQRLLRANLGMNFEDLLIYMELSARPEDREKVEEAKKIVA